MPDYPKGITSLTTHLFDRMDHFIERNRLPKDQSYYADTDKGILAFQAFASQETGPEGYILNYQNSGCSASLPAGRYVQIEYSGAYFTLLAAVLPLEPKSFEEIVPIAENIYRTMVAGGWTTKDYDPEVTQQSIAEYAGGLPQHFYATLDGCGLADMHVEIVIKYYNSLPPGPSIPPAAGEPLPEDYPDRYLIDVGFSAFGDQEREVGALAKARRLAVKGNDLDSLPFDTWLNDPDWRPEGWSGKFIK